MFDKDYIGAWSLPDGKDMVVTITKVVAGTLTGIGNRKNKKPVVYMTGTDKGLALNATNSKTIAAMYGNHVEEWTGKQIALFKTMTQFGSEQMECVRIRPAVPAKGKQTAEFKPDPVSDDEPTPAKPPKKLTLLTPDGAVTGEFAKASEWLDGLKAALLAADEGKPAGQVWDVNAETYASIQTSVESMKDGSGKTAARDLIAAVGALAHERTKIFAGGTPTAPKQESFVDQFTSGNG